MAQNHSHEPIEYDPNFFFPEEFNEMVARDLGEESSVEDVEIDFESSESDYEEDGTVTNEVEVPDSLVVVSQTIRTAPDGSKVVDVTLEVEDVADAVQYDVRVTPA